MFLELSNLGLLLVGFAVTAMLILGVIIFFSNRHGATNQAFLALTIMTSAWSIFNFFTYQNLTPYLSLWLLRLAIFAAVWNSFFVFQLFYIFPKDTVILPKWYFILILFTAGASVLTLTPLIFESIATFSKSGGVEKVNNGPGIIFFAFTVLEFVGGGTFLIIKKTLQAKGVEKKQFKLVLLGVIITFSLILTFNFILPAFFSNSRFVSMAPVFLFPFILFIFYAIARLGFLSIKVIATEIFVMMLSILAIIEVVFEHNPLVLALRVVVFGAVLGFGIFLIRSVRNEIEQRQDLEQLTQALEKANGLLQEADKQKTEFLTIASHQLRTPLSILKGYIELIKDGSYGKIEPSTLKVLDDMDLNNEHLVKLVDTLLDITRIEQGRTKYSFAMNNLCTLIDDSVNDLKLKAKEKKLKLVWACPKKMADVYCDSEKMHHVIYNFIDNALKYSEKGTVKVFLEEENQGITMKVTDQGIGFDKADENNFFQKFYRGDNVRTIGISGTGLGLYVCRKFIEAHSGRVWARSNGLGKGSEFGFWVPVKPKEVPVEQVTQKSTVSL